MANILYAVLAVIAGLFVVSYLTGMAMFALPTIFLVAAVIAGLQHFGQIKLLPWNRNQTKMLFYGSLILGFVFGAFTFISPMLSLSGVQAAFAGTAVTPALPGVQAQTTAAECKSVSQGGTIPDEVYGLGATLTINAWDMESTTPYSAAVDVNPTYFIKNNVQLATVTDTSANTVTSYSVGDIISVYGGSTTYYLTPIEGMCIDRQYMPLDLEAHALLGASNLDITGYDDTGSAALSGGTNSTQEDYDITMGASEDAQFWIKLKANVAAKAYNFGGWAYALGGDAQKLEMLSDGFTDVAAPDWLNVPIDSDDTGGSGANRTGGYDGVFQINTPVMMHEWDTRKDNFNVESSSTDPATSTTFSTQDAIYIGAVDAQYARGDDGKIYLDIYQHNTAESDVGLSEVATLRHPVGGANTVVIELI